EVGAGTDGAIRVILRALSSPDLGYKQYRTYTFMDISSVFLSPAASSLSVYKDVCFTLLDIEADPLAQGFEAQYDVIVASYCLQATTRISETLRNCKIILKPGGKLV
ncbi:hypothetical protein EV127DRAFT_302692, partial [Xylaria flabelliformis]